MNGRKENYTCDICGREVFANERVCAACARDLPAITLGCPACGRRVGEAGMCLECKRLPLLVGKARSPYVHEGEAARLVVRFKRGQKYLRRTFAELSLPLFLREFGDADALTFVPMTPRARKKRGYNQSEEFAREMGAECGLPVLSLEKRRETEAQKYLGREERGENLRGAFRVLSKEEWAGKKVVIVDDTLTTGATVSEIARILKRAGAARVDAFTLTSVEEKHPFGLPPET